jgi:hypothetical protein
VQNLCELTTITNQADLPAYLSPEIKALIAAITLRKRLPFKDNNRFEFACDKDAMDVLKWTIMEYEDPKDTEIIKYTLALIDTSSALLATLTSVKNMVGSNS